MRSTAAQRGEVLIRPPVEIDVATGETFAQQIAQACARNPDRVIVDFEAVIFCDSTAVMVLLSAIKGPEDRCCHLVIRNPSPHLRLIAQILQATEALGLAPQGRRLVEQAR